MMIDKLGTIVLGLAVVLGACSASGDGDDAGGGSGGSGSSRPGGGDDDPGNGQSSADAPKILSLRTNTYSFSGPGALVVSAVVTDPDGIDDLIGGTLTTPDTASAYGAFATDSNEGAYSISLTWTTLNITEAIYTNPGHTVDRVLRAEFYDAEGNTSSSEVHVSLGCGANPDLLACNGACTPVWSSQSCGGCNHVCGEGQYCQDLGGGLACN